MGQETIKTECKRLWQNHFKNVRRKCQYDSDFANIIKKCEKIAESEAIEHFQPWLQILDESIQWLANLTGILDRILDKNSSPELKTAWALVGASCAHAVALRRLILSGLDSTAKAVLRILDEHLITCIVLLHDSKLACDFQNAQDDHEANTFWYQNLNTKALRKHLYNIEKTMGIDSQTSAIFSDWRKNEIKVYSQSIHPSYLSSALAVNTICPSDLNNVKIAFLGQTSIMSQRTLEYACKIIFYFSRFGFLFLFNEINGHSAYITLNPDDEMQQIVVIGREVLLKINSKYWDYSKENIVCC